MLFRFSMMWICMAFLVSISLHVQAQKNEKEIILKFGTENLNSEWIKTTENDDEKIVIWKIENSKDSQGSVDYVVTLNGNEIAKNTLPSGIRGTHEKEMYRISKEMTPKKQSQGYVAPGTWKIQLSCAGKCEATAHIRVVSQDEYDKSLIEKWEEDLKYRQLSQYLKGEDPYMHKKNTRGNKYDLTKPINESEQRYFYNF